MRFLTRKSIHFSVLILLHTLIVLGVENFRSLRRFFLVCTQTKSDVARLDLRNISNALDLSRLERGALPSALEMLVPADIKEIHRDPWQHPYLYAMTSAGGFVVASAGPDGIPGTSDDVAIWSVDEQGSPASR
jgi:general secretion pathway protein G